MEEQRNKEKDIRNIENSKMTDVNPTLSEITIL